MDNLELLTAGAKIYAKKRKFQKNQVEEITFDSDSLKGYLKSFKNRKKDRQKRAELNRKKQLKLDRKEHQKEKKEQLQQQYAEAVAAQRAYYGIDDANSATDGEGDSGDEGSHVDKSDQQDVAEYHSKDTLTTVTVVSEFDPHSTDPYDTLELSGIVQDSAPASKSKQNSKAAAPPKAETQTHHTPLTSVLQA
ncbi:hypothetical protein H4R35_004149 [Dimargaris xerosporica]|nr:hypothetical protein H4R35_004149 [Dimargaris xerosporica]